MERQTYVRPADPADPRLLEEVRALVLPGEDVSEDAIRWACIELAATRQGFAALDAAGGRN